MAVDMFLKLESVEGESADSVHGGEIDLLSWTFAAAQTASSHSGGGAGAGCVGFTDLVLTKKPDRSSPTLFLLCCKGMHIPKGQLTVRKAGGDALEYMVVQLEEVFVTGYRTNGSDGQDQMLEEISLSAKRVGIVYTPQLADGTGGASIGRGWDIGSNVEWEGSW
jgi:type VI secretion system secreted protein Hcp